MVGEIAGESIKSAIALKLRSSFAITTTESPLILYPTIYKEQVVQNMRKPSFFIWTLDVDQSKGMRNKYMRDYQMNVRYHPDEKALDVYEELSAIGNKLLEELSIIDVPIYLGRTDIKGDPIEDKKPIVGHQMSFKITEGVLQMFVTYKIRAVKFVDRGPIMEQVDITER